MLVNLRLRSEGQLSLTVGRVVDADLQTQLSTTARFGAIAIPERSQARPYGEMKRVCGAGQCVASGMKCQSGNEVLGPRAQRRTATVH